MMGMSEKNIQVSLKGLLLAKLGDCLNIKKKVLTVAVGGDFCRCLNLRGAVQHRSSIGRLRN